MPEGEGMGLRSWYRKLMNEPDEWETKKALAYCVWEATLNAATWGAINSVPVRIAIQHIDGSNDHAQAEALIDSKWTPLTTQWDQKTGRAAVVPWTRHFPDKEPYKYWELDDFMR
jgi:hypothetical protein